MRRPDENRAAAHRIVAHIFNREDPSRLAELVAADVIVHDPGFELHGVDRLREALAQLHGAFPDIHYTVEDMVAEHDRVALRFSATGTHQGPFRGLGATGRVVRYTGMAFMRFADGHLTEFWANPDLLILFEQLGAVRAPSAAPGAHLTIEPSPGGNA